MLNTIAIIDIAKCNFDENTFSETSYLIRKLEKIGYDVRKLTILTQNEKNVEIEIESCLKNVHFVIILNDNCFNCKLVECVSRILNFKSKFCHCNFHTLNGNCQWKILKHPTLQIEPVLYFQRIFVINKINLHNVYDNILERFLIYFIKPKPLCRQIKLKSNKKPNVIDKIGNNRDGVNLEFQEDNILKLTGFDLNTLMNTEHDVMEIIQEHVNSTFSDYDVEFENYVNYEKCCLAFKIIEECFQKYKPENVCLSFNGGKDCTVLLHLTLIVLKRKYPNFKESLLCMYVENSDPFPEIQNFISNITKYYNLNVMTVKATIKEALQLLGEKRPNIKACLMGTRRTDPYSENLNVFQMTDSNWPQFMRVSPLLDWHYSDIWDYLLSFGVPYCILYNMGYTSLGNLKNTERNPQLLQTDCEKEGVVYLPAYMLLYESKERSGRINFKL